MEKNEILKVVGYVKVAYPNSFNGLTKDDAKAMINLWYRQFKDFDYDIVMKSIDSIISVDKSNFMPSIGRIKEMIIKLQSKDELTEIEAWNLVYSAICNSTYAQREFDKLPTVVQKLVGSPSQLKEWGLMDTSQVNTVVSSNFQRSYRARAKYEKETMQLPNEIREMLQNLTNAKLLK